MLLLKKRMVLSAAVVIAGALLGGPARAVEPDSSVVAFQDWTVNCAKAPAAKPATPAKAGEAAAPAKESSVCEIVQSFIDKNTQRLIARVAIGRTSAGGELRLVVQTPIGVWLADGASVSVSDKLAAKAVFVRCSPTACFAEGEAKKEFVEGAKSAEKMLLGFPDGARNPVSLTVSTKGFAAALAALDKK